MSVRRLPAPEVLADVGAQLGEGPVWDDRIGALVWVDIEGRRVHRTNTASGATTSIELPEPVGVCLPRASGGYVAALESGFYAVSDEGRVELLAPVDTQTDRLRFNDGACDPQGRFWAGTMAWDHRSGAASLYRLDTDLHLTRVLDGVTTSNGLGWSPDGATMYYVDTRTERIDAFDFDGATGAISRRRPFVHVEGPGRPDGLCVDAEGAVWVALWAGSSVRRYLRDGTLDAVVTLPVAQVSSCGFGGHGLDTLFITTAASGLSTADRQSQPLAGALFRTDPGVRGLPRSAFGG